MLNAAKVRGFTAARAAGLAAALLLTLGGCGQNMQPQGTARATAGSADSTASGPSPAAIAPERPHGTATPADPPDPDGPATPTDETMTDLLQLHTQLKTDLGSAYSDAWIENNQLHVAVTTPEAEAAVTEAGAVPSRAEFTTEQLLAAKDAFKAWLGTDAAPQVQLHWLGTSGRTGSITVRVPADQVQPLTDAVAAHQPAGDVKVIVEESGGLATPLATNGP